MSHRNPPRISPALGKPWALERPEEQIEIHTQGYQTALTIGAWIYCLMLFIGFLACLVAGAFIGGER